MRPALHALDLFLHISQCLQVVLQLLRIVASELAFHLAVRCQNTIDTAFIFGQSSVLLFLQIRVGIKHRIIQPA